MVRVKKSKNAKAKRKKKYKVFLPCKQQLEKNISYSFSLERLYTVSWNGDIFRKFYISNLLDLQVCGSIYILLSPKFALKLAQLKMSLCYLIRNSMCYTSTLYFIVVLVNVCNVRTYLHAPTNRNRNKKPTAIFVNRNDSTFPWRSVEQIKSFSMYAKKLFCFQTLRYIIIIMYYILI